jgi:threonine dehydratase
VYGVEPELAGDAADSFKSGRIIRYTAEQTSRTMADGLRTQSVGALNFMHIQKFVDGVIRINEDQIVAAMKKLLLNWRLVVEPSGAVTTAAALFKHDELPPFRKAVVVISGGNLEPALLKSLL